MLRNFVLEHASLVSTRNPALEKLRGMRPSTGQSVEHAWRFALLSSQRKRGIANGAEHVGIFVRVA
jgi:hypothetical protein